MVFGNKSYRGKRNFRGNYRGYGGRNRRGFGRGNRRPNAFYMNTDNNNNTTN